MNFVFCLQINLFIFSSRQFLLDVKARADTIINNQAKQPTAQVQSVGYDTQSLISEMRDGMNQVKSNIAQVSQKVNSAPACPNVSCVSLTTILVVVAVQLAIILGYNIYR